MLCITVLGLLQQEMSSDVLVIGILMDLLLLEYFIKPMNRMMELMS